ncbi:MAG: hypothetical protein ACFCUI_03760 [Bernardetiaceae bacterium]
MLASVQAQTPKFKVIESKKLSDCNGGTGTTFEQGYVSAREHKPVLIAVYLQHKSGYWDRKEFVRNGPGPLVMKLSSCEYTGNYYAYATYQDENRGNDPFPDVMTVEMRHNARDQAPKFKIVDMEEDANNVEFRYGYVYSPTGKKVEVTFFAEKKDGSWKRKHFTYDGSGRAFIGMKGEEFTGKHKYVIQYVE